MTVTPADVADVHGIADLLGATVPAARRATRIPGFPGWLRKVGNDTPVWRMEDVRAWAEEHHWNAPGKASR